MRRQKNETSQSHLQTKAFQYDEKIQIKKKNDRDTKRKSYTTRIRTTIKADATLASSAISIEINECKAQRNKMRKINK